jgi:hypothetical protein
MGFNHCYVFFGLFALYGIYAAASEGISKHGSAIFQKKIQRPLSATIPLSKSFFTMLASSLADLFSISLERMSLYMTAFVSILIGLYFIFMTTEKSII